MGAIVCFSLLTRKNVVLISATRQPNPLNSPCATPYSVARLLAVCRTFVYLDCAKSPCMHVLIVSNGCEMAQLISDDVKAPAPSATGGGSSGYFSTRVR